MKQVDAIVFLMEMNSYFIGKAVETSEDIVFQAMSNNARCCKEIAETIEALPVADFALASVRIGLDRSY